MLYFVTKFFQLIVWGNTGSMRWRTIHQRRTMPPGSDTNSARISETMLCVMAIHNPLYLNAVDSSYRSNMSVCFCHCTAKRIHGGSMTVKLWKTNLFGWSNQQLVQAHDLIVVISHLIQISVVSDIENLGSVETFHFLFWMHLNCPMKVRFVWVWYLWKSRENVGFILPPYWVYCL